MNQSETKELLLETAKTMLARSDLSLMQKIPILIKVFAGLESGEICCKKSSQTLKQQSALKGYLDQLHDVIKDAPLWILGVNKEQSSKQEYPFAVKNFLEKLQADDQTIEKIKGVLESLAPVKNPKLIPKWEKKSEISASFSLAKGVKEAGEEVHITKAMLQEVSTFIQKNTELSNSPQGGLLHKAIKEQLTGGMMTGRIEDVYVLSFDLLRGVVTPEPSDEFIGATDQLILVKNALLWHLKNPTSKKPELDISTGVGTWEDYLPPGDDLLSDGV